MYFFSGINISMKSLSYFLAWLQEKSLFRKTMFRQARVSLAMYCLRNKNQMMGDYWGIDASKWEKHRFD